MASMYSMAGYSGIMKVKRFCFLAEESPKHRVDALKEAAKMAKGTSSASLLYAVLNKAADLQIDNQTIDVTQDDVDWVNNMKRINNATLTRLDEAVVQAKREGVSGTIRKCLMELGLHYVATNELKYALTTFLELKDFGSHSNENILEVSVWILEVAVVANAFNFVRANAGRILDMAPEDSKARAIAHVALALYHISRSSYREALEHIRLIRYSALHDGDKEGMHLSALSSTLSSTSSTSASASAPSASASLSLSAPASPSAISSSTSIVLLSDEHIAAYGSMLALCVYSRGEMRQYLLENVEFRRFLDSSPQYCSILYQYDQCKFEFLLTNVRLLLQESLAFDMFLTQTRHLEKSIFDHLIVMICGPFTRISIPEMADTLGCSVNVLEEELVFLITSRTLSARIDSSAKVLLSKEVDAKVATYNKVLELGDNCIREAKFNLLRMSLLESKLYLGTEERRIFGGHN